MDELVKYDREELLAALKKAAETIDEEIAQLEKAATPTQETMRIEFAI